MKKLFTITALGFILFSNAQTTAVNFGANLKSVQLELERQEEHFYYKVQAEYNFEETYKNVGFGMGYNVFLNRFETTRFYIGGKIGLISHENQAIAGNATFGAETGVDFKLTDKIVIGGRYTMDWREDLKFYGVNYNPSFKGAAFLKIGFKLN